MRHGIRRIEPIDQEVVLGEVRAGDLRIAAAPRSGRRIRPAHSGSLSQNALIGAIGRSNHGVLQVVFLEVGLGRRLSGINDDGAGVDDDRFAERELHRHVDLRLLIQIDNDVLAHCCLDAVELVLRAVRAGWQGGENVLALRVGNGGTRSLQLRAGDRHRDAGQRISLPIGDDPDQGSGRSRSLRHSKIRNEQKRQRQSHECKSTRVFHSMSSVLI